MVELSGRGPGVSIPSMERRGGNMVALKSLSSRQDKEEGNLLTYQYPSLNIDPSTKYKLIQKTINSALGPRRK